MEKREFVTYKPGLLRPEEVGPFCTRFSQVGTEVFFDDLVPRDEPLCPTWEAEEGLLRQLQELRVCRAHGSYWAYPTAFLTGRNREELYARMGGASGVRAYFGDETGEAIFSRWVSEYALCRKAGIESYTFHLIDYAPIDGKWCFSLTREEILAGMAEMLAQFLSRLEGAGLLEDSGPRIELENAGWGLEYGAQRADDFVWILERVKDPHGLLRVSWDVNHLLHALGRGHFLLPEDEVSDGMAALPMGEELAQAWLEANLMDDRLLGRVGAVHLSDRPMADVEYFRRGKLCQPYHGELMALPDGEAQEAYGVDIVLSKYDAHTPVGNGEGYLTGSAVAGLLERLSEANGGLLILHELKNSKDLAADLSIQRRALGWGE